MSDITMNEDDAAGHNSKARRNRDDRYEGDAGVFQNLSAGSKTQGPSQSVEGWIIIVSNVHEEAQEEDLSEAFQQYGEIKNFHLNLDRRTGFVKGYALIEYEAFQDAKNAIEAMKDQEILERKIQVDWAFNKLPLKGR